MKEVTKQLIHDFHLNKYHIDMMGYPFTSTKQLSFHHMIIPHSLSDFYNLPSDGYVYWNGAILVQHTSHDYFHLIQQYSPYHSDSITSELIDLHIASPSIITPSTPQIHYIDLILTDFENIHKDTTHKKKRIIKPEYFNRRRI